LSKEFFEFVVNLKKVDRQGWKEKLGMKFPESVADHCYSTALVAMTLSDSLHLETEKIIKMALLHDLSESIIGDLTSSSISKDDKINLENNAMEKILRKLPDKLYQEYMLIWHEYTKMNTVESNLLHEIDKFEMAFQAILYSKDGHSKEKIQPFMDSANEKIKNKQLKEILSMSMQEK